MVQNLDQHQDFSGGGSILSLIWLSNLCNNNKYTDIITIIFQFSENAWLNFLYMGRTSPITTFSSPLALGLKEFEFGSSQAT